MEDWLLDAVVEVDIYYTNDKFEMKKILSGRELLKKIHDEKVDKIKINDTYSI